MKTLLPSFFLLFLCSEISAQDNPNQPNIFLDCNSGCDFDYVKQEINYVDYMLDRVKADIYIQITDLPNGGGGSQVQLVFQGSEQFSSRADTIQYIVDPNATRFIRREQLVKELKSGLLPYIIQTSLLDGLEYTVTVSENTISSDSSAKDPWNYWVFNVGGNGWIDAEENFKTTNLNTRLSASRVTDDHKFRLSSNYNYNESYFKLTDGDEITTVQENYNLNLFYVKSINENWSAGIMSYAGSSTFGNRDFSSSIKAAVEYNIYPYSEAQTRRFTFLYSIGPEYYDYTAETVYDQLNETVLRHGLGMEFRQTHKMGDFSFDLGVDQYLHNPKLYSAYINPSVRWQLVKGLSFRVRGFFSFVNDRLNIAKEDISDEDILLQVKQLNTQFSYFTSFGLEYRFGSSSNNYVNARF